ncbi:hypothetical protein H5410_042345 [Solanum commersonii]|uniref:Uncharacterized protein n=1 Tax=Solanum commersonii TaxID=4109 RepID=A0A9J5XW44_SOLCO|nr:hypothetical protein H5410_042345 [Solanum commersonii]
MDHIGRGRNAREATNQGQNQAPNTIDNNSRRQSMQEAMEILVDKYKERLQHLQNTIFQLANYYFVFQGVILGSISHSSSLNCSNRWFLFSLSLFAAIINLYAIFSMGRKYIVTLRHYDIAWKDYNDLMFELSSRHQLPNEPTQIGTSLIHLTRNSPLLNHWIELAPRNRSNEQRVQNSYVSSSNLSSGSISIQTPQPARSSPHQRVGDQVITNEDQVHLNQQWEDLYTKIKRGICLTICLVLLGAFAGIILHGCWSILCKNDDKCSLSQSNSNCIKLCDISKCMTVCSEF